MTGPHQSAQDVPCAPQSNEIIDVMIYSHHRLSRNTCYFCLARPNASRHPVWVSAPYIYPRDPVPSLQRQHSRALLSASGTGTRHAWIGMTPMQIISREANQATSTGQARLNQVLDSFSPPRAPPRLPSSRTPALSLRKSLATRGPAKSVPKMVTTELEIGNCCLAALRNLQTTHACTLPSSIITNLS